MPFICYVDTEAMLIPQDQFDKHKNEEEEKEEDLGLEALHDYFGFINEEDAEEWNNYSPDSDFEYEDDNQEIPTRRCSSKRIQNKKAKEEEEKRKQEEEEIQLDQLHPWSDKRLKITSSHDVNMALKQLEKKTNVINKHKMASYGVKVVGPPHLQHHFEDIYLYRGEYAELEFVKCMAQLQNKIEVLFETEGNTKMKTLTTEQQEIYNSTKQCHICKQEISNKDDMATWQKQCQELKKKNLPVSQSDGKDVYLPKFKPYFKSETDRLGPGKLYWLDFTLLYKKLLFLGVRDHCHWTGEFRGSYLLKEK